MIEEVEEFSTKFDLLPLPDFEILLQSEIKRDQVRPAQVANTRVTKLMCGLLAWSEWRGCKCSLIEPTIKRLMARVSTAKICLLG